MKNPNKQSGFLLISLVVVLGIIMILLAISWGGFSKKSPVPNGDGNSQSAATPPPGSDSILNPYPQNTVTTGHKAIQDAQNLKAQSDLQNKTLQQQLNAGQ